MRALWRVEETMGGRRRVSSGFRGYASAKIRIETQRERTKERERKRERESKRARERERDWERMKGACKAFLNLRALLLIELLVVICML